jgi:hypothetical protein
VETALDRRRYVFQNAHRAVLPEQEANAANAGTRREEASERVSAWPSIGGIDGCAFSPSPPGREEGLNGRLEVYDDFHLSFIDKPVVDDEDVA